MSPTAPTIIMDEADRKSQMEAALERLRARVAPRPLAPAPSGVDPLARFTLPSGGQDRKQ